MKDLIKITTNDKGQQLVSGRELHEFLEVKSRFNDWIANRINKYEFIEFEDYIAITKTLVTAQGNKSNYIDYALTIDMAKELSMVENNEKGKQARRYFIECEKKAKEKQYTLKEVSEEVKLEFIAFECTANLLNLNEVSKLAGAEKIYDDHGISKAALPKYVKSKGVTKSATELLKKFNAGISATKFNKLMIEKGYLKELERRSTKNPDKPKKFKNLVNTKYGENQVNPKNPKETQPMYYEEKFEELLKELSLI